MDDDDEDKNKKDKKIILANIKSVLIYCLSLSVALGFNDLITTIFNSFPGSNHIIKKTIYVVVMFGITLSVAFWLFELKQNLN